LNLGSENINGDPKNKDMKTGVLYPFVDMLWVEEENGSSISAIQCTVSETHRKHVDVYQNLRNRLELASDTKLIVYMATIPRSVEKKSAVVFSREEEIELWSRQEGT
jgi:hypothetical protein